MKFTSIFFLLFLMLSACEVANQQAVVTNISAEETYVEPHIFIIMADDLGLDVAPCHSSEIYMPNMQARCDTSLIFDKAYAYPYCSPTRASLLTGRHSFRHGVNDVLQSAKKLPLAEITLPEWISTKAPHYRTAAFGKWHLADDINGGANNPNTQGFDHYEGTPRQAGTYSYFDYDWYINGKIQGKSTTYKTTKITNSVIGDFIANNEMPQFHYVNYVNPHLPYHTPPKDLHNINLPKENAPKTTGIRRDTKLDPYYFAMLQSLDTEIERLIDRTVEITERPIVFIFLGDNGSAQNVYRGDISGGYRAKSSLYEGGIRIPMQIWSSDNKAYPIMQGRTDAFTHIVDLYATILQIIRPESELPDVPVDSVNFAPAFTNLDYSKREYVYVEAGHLRKLQFSYAAINASGMKLLLTENGREPRFLEDVYLEYYDTLNDPGELLNLLEKPCDVNLADANDLLEFIIMIQESEEKPMGARFDKDFYKKELRFLEYQCTK